MGEIEGLDTHEPLPRRVERHAFDRLIMLSDGVFAIAMTLAAVEIRPRGAWTDMMSLWGALRLPIFAYALSFAVIAAYWASHRDVFARLEKVDAPLTVLTMAQLCGIALLPTTTRLVYEGGSLVAFQIYGLSVAFVGVAQGAIWGYASFRRGLMKPEVTYAYRLGHVVLAFVVPLYFTTLAALIGLGLSSSVVAATLAMSAGVAVLRGAVLPRLERRAAR